MGLLDFMNTDDARFGINLLAAASPTMQPMGFGGRLALAMRMNDEQRQRSLEEQMRKEQMRLVAQKADRDQQQIEQQSAFMSKLGNLLGGSQQQSAPQPVPLPELGEAQGTGPYRLNVDTPQERANLAKQLDYLAKNDPQAHQQVIAALVKQGSIPQPMQQAPAQQTNWNDVASLSAAGQLAGIHGAAGLMELAKFNKPDWQQVDSGGQIQFINKNGQQMPVIAKTMSPDAIASNQVAWANNAIAQQNANLAGQKFEFEQRQAKKPMFHDGQWVVPPEAGDRTGASIPIPGYQKPLGETQKKQLTGIGSLNSAIGEYLTEMESWSNGKAVTPSGRAEMGTKYNNMMLQAKEAYNLGVLNGPDYEILQSVVTDPTSPKGMFTPNAALKKQAEELRRMMEGTASSVRGGGQTVAPKSTMSGGGWSATVIE